MGYLIRLVPELRAWLAGLCAADPAAAELAGAAIIVLLTAGGRAGPPLIVPAGRAAPQVPRGTLDDSYQRLLSQLTGVRRAVAEVATARKRLELQISQLAAAEGSAQRTGILHQLRDEYARLGVEEARLSAGARQLQSWVSEFRSRKEALKASYAVAEAQRTINSAYAEFGAQTVGASAPFPAADDTIQSLASSIAGITRAAGLDPQPSEPPAAAPGATGQPQVTLAELRCGWPSEPPLRILFAVEDTGPAGREDPAGVGRLAGEDSPAESAVAVLLAAGPAVSPLRGEADALIPLALDRYRAARDQPGTRYTSESFCAEFFPAPPGRCGRPRPAWPPGCCRGGPDTCAARPG